MVQTIWRWLIPDTALRWGWSRRYGTPTGPNIMGGRGYVIKGVRCWPFGRMTGLTNP